MLNALVDAGVREDTPPSVARRLRLANKVALFQGGLSAFFIVFGLVMQPGARLFMTLSCGAFMSAYALVVCLNHAGRSVAGRSLLLSVMSFGIAGAALVADPTTGLANSLIALAPLPLLLFGRDERRATLLWALAPLVLHLAVRALRPLLPTLPYGATSPALPWLASMGAFFGLLWQVMALQGENARSEEALGRARDLALEASRQKSEFLANMSHEIRTPLTAILGYADLLAPGCSGEALSSVETIRRNGQHLLGVLSDILDLSKIEAGRMVVERIPCALGPLVLDAAELMRVRALDKGLAFEVRYEGPVPERIHSDPTRLRQILLNLVGNAVKFTERGSVALSVRLAGGPAPRLSFQISDTGIGMAPEDLGRLFQPFTQADASMTRRFGGTGLGLVICQRLAAMLGGGISVDSEMGRGSRFTVTVDPGPLEGVAMQDRPRPAAQPAPAPQPAADQLRGVRVLLAEDGRDNQLLISTMLRRAGAEVTVADHGQAALEKALEAEAQRRPFGVILMDMQMPEMDGYEATAALRLAGCQRPVVALTAHAMAGDRERCLAAGCDDYLTKPVDQALLIETARRCSAPPSTTLHAVRRPR